MTENGAKMKMTKLGYINFTRDADFRFRMRILDDTQPKREKRRHGAIWIGTKTTHTHTHTHSRLIVPPVFSVGARGSLENIPLEE